MNVRIEDQNLRFKITEDELKVLLDGHCLHVRVDLLEKSLVATINPNGHGRDIEPKLVMNQNNTCLHLLVPPSRVQALFDLGKNRDGLVQEIGGVSIILQVDMKEACHA